MSKTNPTHETTGGRLARLRRAQNITQEELAERLGISRQAVSKWESDLAYPETDKLLTLSRLYGCTVDYLLTGEEPVPPLSQTQARAAGRIRDDRPPRSSGRCLEPSSPLF